MDVVDRLPYAILVEDAHGRLTAHNRAAERALSGVVDLDAGAEVGCALLGCRLPGGALEGACLHARAREQDGPLPELRIDLPRGAGLEAAWVTVTALGPDRELVVTELRPADRGDRRRRTEPHWTTGPQLRIFALGRTRVMSAETDIGGRWLDNRPGQILKLLVADRHRRVFSDEIVERLWPAGTHDTRGLRSFVHALRDHLEPQGAPSPPSSFVLATRGGYVLHETRVWIDADVFESLLAEGRAAFDGGEDRQALELLHRGLELYRGDFLGDEPYAEWALPERERLRRIAGEGLRVLAMLHERGGDLTAAAASLARLADLEPYDVEVHRDLLTLLLRRGRRSEALRRYDTLRRRVLTTFGEPLDFTLAELVANV
jgi:DNA-binding SARP family transcriptional activator